MLCSGAMGDETVEVGDGISSKIMKEMASYQPLMLTPLCIEMDAFLCSSSMEKFFFLLVQCKL